MSDRAERAEAERDWLAAALRRLASGEWLGTQGYDGEELQRRADFARDKLAAVAPLPFPGEAAERLAALGEHWTVTELAAALDGFRAWFTVAGGGARLQGQLLGADVDEFARALHARLDANRAHREPGPESLRPGGPRLAPGEDPDDSPTEAQRAEYLAWRAARGLSS